MPQAIPIALGGLFKIAAGLAIPTLGGTGLAIASSLGMVVGGFIAHNLAESSVDANKELKLNRRSTSKTIPIIYGTRKIGSNDFYINLGGSDYDHLWIFHGICEGDIEGIVDDREQESDPHDWGIWIDEKRIKDWAEKLSEDQIQWWFYNGTNDWGPAPGQPGSDMRQYMEDDGLINVEGAEQYQHTAYIVFRIIYDTSVFSGITRRQVEVKGTKVPDLDAVPPSSIRTYSVNPVRCLYDYLTNKRYGTGFDEDLIDIESFRSARDDCDANGWELNYTITSKMKAQTIIDTILSHMRGGLIWYDGKLSIIIKDLNYTAGSIGNDDIIADENGVAIVSITQPSTSDIPTRAIARYISTSGEWNVDSVPLMVDTVTDSFGIDNPKTYEFPGYTDKTLAMNMALYLARTELFAITVSLSVRLGQILYDPFDVIQLSCSEISFSDQKMRVLSTEITEDGLVNLQLIMEDEFTYEEFSGDIYDQEEDIVFPDQSSPPPPIEPYDKETNPSPPPDYIINEYINYEVREIEDAGRVRLTLRCGFRKPLSRVATPELPAFPAYWYSHTVLYYTNKYWNLSNEMISTNTLTDFVLIHDDDVFDSLNEYDRIRYKDYVTGETVDLTIIDPAPIPFGNLVQVDTPVDIPENTTFSFWYTTYPYVHNVNLTLTRYILDSKKVVMEGSGLTSINFRTGDKILLKDEILPEYNRIYTVVKFDWSTLTKGLITVDKEWPPSSVSGFYFIKNYYDSSEEISGYQSVTINPVTEYGIYELSFRTVSKFGVYQLWDSVPHFTYQVKSIGIDTAKDITEVRHSITGNNITFVVVADKELNHKGYLVRMKPSGCVSSIAPADLKAAWDMGLDLGLYGSDTFQLISQPHVNPNNYLFKSVLSNGVTSENPVEETVVIPDPLEGYNVVFEHQFLDWDGGSLFQMEIVNIEATNYLKTAAPVSVDTKEGVWTGPILPTGIEQGGVHYLLESEPIFCGQGLFPDDQNAGKGIFFQIGCRYADNISMIGSKIVRNLERYTSQTDGDIVPKYIQLVVNINDTYYHNTQTFWALVSELTKLKIYQNILSGPTQLVIRSGMQYLVGLCAQKKKIETDLSLFVGYGYFPIINLSSLALVSMGVEIAYATIFTPAGVIPASLHVSYKYESLFTLSSAISFRIAVNSYYSTEINLILGYQLELLSSSSVEPFFSIETRDALYLSLSSDSQYSTAFEVDVGDEINLSLSSSVSNSVSFEIEKKNALGLDSGLVYEPLLGLVAIGTPVSLGLESGCVYDAIVNAVVEVRPVLGVLPTYSARFVIKVVNGSELSLNSGAEVSTSFDLSVIAKVPLSISSSVAINTSLAVVAGGGTVNMGLASSIIYNPVFLTSVVGAVELSLYANSRYESTYLVDSATQSVEIGLFSESWYRPSFFTEIREGIVLSIEASIVIVPSFIVAGESSIEVDIIEVGSVSAECFVYYYLTALLLADSYLETSVEIESSPHLSLDIREIGSTVQTAHVYEFISSFLRADTSVSSEITLLSNKKELACEIEEVASTTQEISILSRLLALLQADSFVESDVVLDNRREELACEIEEVASTTQRVMLLSYLFAHLRADSFLDSTTVKESKRAEVSCGMKEVAATQQDCFIYSYFSATMKANTEVYSLVIEDNRRASINENIREMASTYQDIIRLIFLEASILSVDTETIVSVIIVDPNFFSCTMREIGSARANVNRYTFLNFDRAKRMSADTAVYNLTIVIANSVQLPTNIREIAKAYCMLLRYQPLYVKPISADTFALVIVALEARSVSFGCSIEQWQSSAVVIDPPEPVGVQPSLACQETQSYILID